VLAVLGVGAAGRRRRHHACCQRQGELHHGCRSGQRCRQPSPGATGFAQGRFNDDVNGDIKSLKTLNLVTPILLAAGGAMLVGGIVMIVIDRGNKKKGKGFYANRSGHGVQLGGIGAAPLPGGGAAGSLALHF
jgi:hypothetical protein